MNFEKVTFIGLLALVGCTTQTPSPPNEAVPLIPIARPQAAIPPSPGVRVGLSWDASSSTNVTGYKIYWGGSSGGYTNSKDAGLVTHTTVPGLPSGGIYYFAATAYDTNGNESVFSNEARASLVPKRSIALTILAGPSPDGPWSDVPVSWVLPAAEGWLFFRLQIEAVP